MIYGYKQVAHHRLFELHTELRHFLSGIRDAQEFGEGLFHEWFVPVLKKCEKLRSLLGEIFSAIKNGATTADDFLEVFDNNNEIKRLCKDPGFDFKAWRCGAELDSLLQRFADYIYDELPERQSLLDAVEGGGYRNYYKVFRDQNLDTVCPFCGIETLPDYFEDERQSKLPRASYDHYLCRTEFPLSAINFANLIPCCKQCNEDAKGAKPVIFSQQKSRRPAPYPFDPPINFEIKLKQTSPALVDSKARWEIEFKPRLSTDQEAFATWLSIYNIKERWESRVEGRARAWETFTLQELLPEAGDISAMRNDIDKKHGNCNTQTFIRNEVDGILKLAFFEHLKGLDDAALLSAMRALEPIAKTLPTNLLGI